MKDRLDWFFENGISCKDFGTKDKDVIGAHMVAGALGHLFIFLTAFNTLWAKAESTP